jgi:TATA-box binding protein (TBP) (component of TFIID and TFIIIB)
MSIINTKVLTNDLKSYDSKVTEHNGKKELKFPDFDGIKVSTKTFIVITNIILDIKALFDFLPITKYILVPKRRGRKKKIEPQDPNKDIPFGSIITLEYQNDLRGIDLKKKKRKKDKGNGKRGSYFRNSVTIVMIMNGKKINYKVSRNGKFQMTGCKSYQQAESCVKCFWEYIRDNNKIYKLKIVDDNIKSPVLKTIFVPAMRNIDFALNFKVDREKLDEYFNTNTPYHSLLETSFGYTGVNIKIPIAKPIQEQQLKQIKWVNGKWKQPETVPYSDYLKMLPEKDQQKKLKKRRYNTFLVFHSGKCIHSGMSKVYMKNGFEEFIRIIRECYDYIEERLD